MTLQGAPVAQEVAKDIETSAMQASLERQARLGENDDDSHGIWDFHFRSTARRTSRQGVSTFGRSGMSTPLSDADMPSLPAFCSFMDFGHNRYYDWGPATDPPPPLSQDTQDALHAAAEGRLRRPPKVFLAQLNTVRAASGSGRSAQDALLTFAEASAGSADVSGQQTQDAQGGNCVQSASPNAASSNAPVTGVATTTGEAVVAGTATAAANKLVLMIAESDDRVCYYPADRESVFALGSVFTS